MPKKDTILAVDIGADSLKFAEFSYPQNGGIVLENFAFTEYGGDLKEEELLDVLAEAFHSTILEQGFESKKIHLSISGQSAFLRFVKLPPIAEEEEEKVRQIVQFEAKENVPFPIEEVVWDYQLIANPDEEESEIEVMFVVVKNDLIESVINIIEEAGLEPEIVEVAPTACYNAARANEIGGDECVMILNIGGKSSTLVFIDSGRFFVRSIPIAGHTVTQQISKEFGISFADAEEMKRRHGFVALGGAYEEPDSEVAATVSKIVRNVMTRLHGEINRSINVYRSQQKGSRPTKLYLAGGSSVMAFTPRFFSEKLRIPVEYFNPFRVVSLSDNIDREELAEVAHMFSEVIGLGLRHITVCPIEISILPDKIKKYHELKQKTPYFYASAASLLLCLGVTYWGISRHSQFEYNRVRTAEDVISKTQHVQALVSEAKSELDTLKTNYENANSILAHRRDWCDLLNALQKVLPDRTWLTKISKTTKPAKETKKKKRGGGFMFGGPGIFPLFQGTQTSRRTSGSTEDIEWIEIEGHSLCEKGVTSYEECFRQNLLKSPMFTDNNNEIKTTNFEPTRGNNNITSFTIKIKLKKPIKQNL